MDVRLMDDIAYLLDVIARDPGPDGQLESALRRQFGIVQLARSNRDRS
jgi:hypothetical protein